MSRLKDDVESLRHTSDEVSHLRTEVQAPGFRVSEYSCLTAHQHNIGHSVP